MSRTSPSITISAVSSTVLRQLADSLSVGTWVEFSGANAPSGMVAALCVGPTSGNMIPYATKCGWNSTDNVIEIVGADHPFGTPMRHVRYNESNNSFTTVFADAAINDSHNNNLECVNPTTGDTYFKGYGTGPLYRFNRSTGSWSTLTSTFPSGMTGQIHYGVDFWSGSLSGVGAEGGIVILSCASTTSRLNVWDIQAGAWRSTILGPSIGSTYNQILSYSSVHNVAVFGGANTGSTSVWRLNSDATWTALTSSPIAFGLTRGQIVSDPVSGDFLLHSEAGSYVLDPTGSGTWTELTGSRVPPPEVNRNVLNGNGVPGIILTPMPEHGVIAAISATGGSSARMHIYKHA